MAKLLLPSGLRRFSLRNLRGSRVASLLLTVLVLETCSFLALQTLGGTTAEARLQASLQQETDPSEIDGDEVAATADEQVFHPYMGTALPPEELAVVAPEDPDYLEYYGFGPGSGPFIREPQEDAVVVGVFGGSVARQMAGYGPSARQFRRELGKLPAFGGKESIFVLPANYGYKQPQQLMALNYLLSVGAHFDVIINIDGFNEVAMPYEENYSHGVFPFYPRFWDVRMQSLNTAPELRRTIGRIALHRERQQESAALIARTPVGWSATARLLWKLHDSRLQASVHEAEEELFDQRVSDNAGYVVTGPSRIYGSTEEFFADIAENWRMSSLLMHQLAASRGAEYVHVLQPNQYVPGSKQMGDEERAVAYREDHHYRRDVERGYPYLQAAAAPLEEAGVALYDATMLFADEPGQMYIDDCCHLTPDGYGRLAAWVAGAVADAMQDVPADSR